MKGDFYVQEEKLKIRTRYNIKSLREEIEKYFNHCTKDEEIPTKEGMQIFLNITQNTINEWKKKQKDTFLQQIYSAYAKIKHINLQRFLKASPNSSAWYLERAYVKDYNLSRKIDINTDNTHPIVIQLQNKSKTKC